MSQTSQAESSTTQSSTAQSSTQTSNSPDDDWSSVTDPNERRKIQNRIAQRKFREKVRQQREESDRNADNQKRAGGSYVTAEPDEVDAEEEGLPWEFKRIIDLCCGVKSRRQFEVSVREMGLVSTSSTAMQEAALRGRSGGHGLRLL